MLSKYGTEQIGISVEVALADLTGVSVDPSYRGRGRSEIVQHVRPVIESATHHFPRPLKHIAGDRNPVDFLLEDDKTLSVKSNMREAGKLAPQNIGQPTSTTFWSRLPELVPEGIHIASLSYTESAQVFKQVAQSEIVKLLGEYWKNLFDCDYMLYVFDVLDKSDNPSRATSAKVFKRSESPDWQLSKISFTKSLADWNESCTVKYGKFSVGEFQIHNKRNCFKFRFNVNGLIGAGLL